MVENGSRMAFKGIIRCEFRAVWVAKNSERHPSPFPLPPYTQLGRVPPPSLPLEGREKEKLNNKRKWRCTLLPFYAMVWKTKCVMTAVQARSFSMFSKRIE